MKRWQSVRFWDEQELGEWLDRREQEVEELEPALLAITGAPEGVPSAMTMFVVCGANSSPRLKPGASFAVDQGAPCE